MSTLAEPRYLTVQQAAERLAVSPLTIRRRIASGELGAFRLGDGPSGLLRIPAAAVDELLQPVEATAS